MDTNNFSCESRLPAGWTATPEACRTGSRRPTRGDNPERQLHREEVCVAVVCLSAVVGGGPVHLRHRADGAVDARAAQLAVRVEAGDARLVDAFGGLGQGFHPRGELAGPVPERPVLDLARGRREGAGLYRSGVDVEPYEGGSIVHRKPLP